jgi:tRNA threonylcarbamoyladenosine biosynthesis protein TsaB
MESRFSHQSSTASRNPAASGHLQPHSSQAPLLLALSVHWDDCSVALGTAERWVEETWSLQPERMPTQLPIGAAAAPLASRDALLLLDRLLIRTGTTLGSVDRLCFARGPGAFTSLRVAAGLIQGLSLATSIPVVGICSLAAMAALEPAWQGGAGAEPTSWLQLSAIDARMGECYFGLHECRSGHHPVPLFAAAVGKPADAIAVFDEVLAQRASHEAKMALALAGNAFTLLPQLADWASRNGFDPRLAGTRLPSAAAVLAVAASIGAPQAGPAATALPVYVRDKIAFDLSEQRANAAARTLASVGGTGGPKTGT